MTLDPLEPRTFLSAVKIMPLGDSITEGAEGHASYRFWLWKRLNLAGYDVDFVGSRTGVGAPGGGQTAPLYTDWDVNHEGHSGWRTDQILDKIDEWAPQFAPDVVLLHLGTNDMLQSHTVQETVDRLGQIIDTIRASRPNVKIAMAKIIPSRVLNNNIIALNNQIPGIVSAKNTAQSPVVLVDQFAGYDAFADNYDEYHPNPRGERKMTAKWLPAVTGLLGAPPEPPAPVTYLSDLTWTSMTNGHGPVERDLSNGEGSPDDGGAIEINGVTSIKGLGAHAQSQLEYDLDGQYARFRASVGMDDEVGSGGSVRFRVFVDGVERFNSGTMTNATAARAIDVDVTGADTLRLVLDNAGDGNASDHADWADARLVIAPRVTADTFRFATAPQALEFTFTRNVGASLGTGDLLLENLTTSQTIPSSSIDVTYNEATNTARFTFPGLTGGVLPDGSYRATIDASGVTDAQGNVMLDDHVATFRFLVGDANNDGQVNLDDFDILAANFGESNRDFTQGDFTYDDTVNLQDFNLLAARFGRGLAPGTSTRAGNDVAEDDFDLIEE